MIATTIWRPTHLSIIFRSSHNLIALLKSPKRALRKKVVTEKPTPQKLRLAHKNDDLLSMIPAELYRKTCNNTKMSHRLYLTNEETAVKIAQHLTHLPEPDVPLVEMNPGTGVLTSLLLQGGIKDLRLFEGREEFVPHLEETYSNVYPDRVQLKNVDLISLHRIIHPDQLNSKTKGEEIFSDFPVTEWQDDISFRLFGATGSTLFIKQVIASIVFQNGMLALGRFEMYLVIPSATYVALTSSTKSGLTHYRAVSIIFQLFFEYEILDKYPRAHFLPNITNMGKYLADRKSMECGVNLSEADPDQMYFVKIVPRRDLYEQCTPEQIQELWHFIRRNCHSRQTRIIPLLEKLIPGSGLRLLLQLSTQKRVRPQLTNRLNLCKAPPTTNPSMTLSHQDYYGDLNVYTQLGDLQPTELFTLFREFCTLPEYSTCNFLPSLDMTFLKIGANDGELEVPIAEPKDDTSYIDDELEENDCEES